MDCSVRCPPHWIEPVVQQRQTLVFPTSASVSLKCPYMAKPQAKITWFKDGQLFSPELYELVKNVRERDHQVFVWFLVFYRSSLLQHLESDDVRRRHLHMSGGERCRQYQSDVSINCPGSKSGSASIHLEIDEFHEIWRRQCHFRVHVLFGLQSIRSMVRATAFDQKDETFWFAEWTGISQGNASSPCNALQSYWSNSSLLTIYCL